MSDISPEKFVKTHIISGPTAAALQAELAQFIKDMEDKKDIEYTIVSVTPAIQVRFKSRSIEADDVFEVGVEGDLFNPHPRDAYCETAGCENAS